MVTTDLFLSAVKFTSFAFQRELKQGSLRIAFERYKSYLQTVSQRYNPARKIASRELDNRFRDEVSSVAVLISIIDNWFNLNDAPSLASMTVNGIETYFPRFRLPREALALCINIAEQIRVPEDLGNLMQMASSQVIESSSKYALSEYYTPTSIAQQLVAYAFPSKLDCTGALRIVDPACGHGSLLALSVKRYVQKLRQAGRTPDEIIQRLLGSVYGFDIQPYSVILTRLNLLVQTASLFKQATWAIRHVEETLFSNVVLDDPLPKGRELWRSGNGFDIIIANPPYSKVVNSHVPFIRDYDDVVYGHANLYQLFLWWAIQAARPDGSISFLVPQSFRSGQYFKKLREKINETCSVNAIAHISHRTDAFEDVDQALACISLRKKSDTTRTNRVAKIEIFRNGTQAHQPTLTESFKVKPKDLLRNLGTTTVWVLSDRKSDYEILDKVFRYTDTLFGQSNSIKITNGGFVWNQQKPSLSGLKTRLAKPLISADSISPFRLEIPVSQGSISFNRQFVISAEELNAPLYRSEAMLVQRTTAHKSGRRVIGALVTERTFALHNGYYVENHVNVIQVISDCARIANLSTLCGLTGWVNSRLLNFVFDMINGSAHISGYELKMLPYPEELIPLLSLPAKKVATASAHHYNRLYEELDRIVADYFHLTKRQGERLQVKIR